MRVALFAETFLPKTDGVATTTCHLLEHLSRRGHQALVFAPDGAPERYAGMPVVALAPRDASYHRMLSNLEEVRAREGRVIAVAHEGDRDVERVAEAVLTVPGTAELLGPLVSVIPLQLLAYHVARLRGCDVDQPRNLAKSVTVE